MSEDRDDIWLAYESWANDEPAEWTLFEFTSGQIAWNFNAYGGSNALLSDLQGYLSNMYPNGVPEEYSLKIVRYSPTNYGYDSDEIDVIKEMEND